MSDYEYSDADSYHYSEGGSEDENMSDGNSGGANYSDDEMSADETNLDINIQIENAYYEAKQMRDDGMLDESVNLFEKVIQMQTEHRDELKRSNGGRKWTFKALKQLVKMHLQYGDEKFSSSADGLSPPLAYFNRLLDFISKASAASVNEYDLTPNEIEKGINSILERVSSLAIAHSAGGAIDTSHERLSTKNRQQLLLVYEATLRVFRPSSEKSAIIDADMSDSYGQVGRGICINDRLWFKTNLKLGQVLYEMNETYKLQNVIKDLMKNHQSQESMVDKSLSSSSSGSSTHLLEIYALQIQLYSRQKDNKKLREIFRKAMRVEGGIPHPRTLALIQELGGKMHMESREFEMATKTFFQAFKSYDEAGDPSRLRCLKYLVMAGMLDRSVINPFDSQEARPYKDNPEITAMTNLVAAFHNNEIEKFESILRRNEGNIMNDEFVKSHIADLLRTIRTQVLQSVIEPYTRMTLTFLAASLNNISIQDVESILVSLILDGKLDAKIDQVNGILMKSSKSKSKQVEDDTFDAIDKLSNAILMLSSSVTSVSGKNPPQREVFV